ncbi:ParA family protein [Anaerococcus provencensis]|uniref:ParA family protein n=1 Tax=Anaerococcus provencensis TaxID=938293 RepID=UPI00030D0C67|nr:ParA family protein [Anaerococcus provencensis]
MKVISVFNQKGGVGKTTTVVNLAVALANLSKKVLVVDIDPQANTTSGLGLDKYNIDTSLYDLFYANEEVEMSEDSETVEEVGVIANDESEEVNDQVNIEEVNKETYEVEEDDSNEEKSDHLEEIEEPESIDINEYISQTKSGVDIIPSEAALSGLEVELVALDPIERTQQLKGLIADIDGYDYVLIDCPPSLGLLSINALVASDSIVIPVQAEYYALEGISELMNTFNLVKKQLNTDLEIEGVLLTMFDKRTYLSYEVVEEVKSYFKDKVFKVMIPRNPRLAEAPSHGLSTIEYDIKSPGAYAYQILANEINESESVNE